MVKLGNENGSLKLRKKKSTSSDILDNLKHGTVLEVLEDDGEWLKVRVNGKEGYVSKKYTVDPDDFDTTTKKPTKEPTAEVTPENTEPNEPQDTLAPDNTEATDNTVAPENTEAPENTKAPEDTPKPESTEAPENTPASQSTEQSQP